MVPVPPFKDASGLNPYGDFVMQVDHHMGELLEVIREAGLEENTLVIFTSDNGCSPEANFGVLAEHGHDPSAGYRGHKADLFEGGHRVPVIARWPGHIEPGRSTTALACLTDIYSTLEAIVGQPRQATGGEDGFSWLPLFAGENTNGRTTLISHSIGGLFAIRQGSWKLLLASGSGGWSQPTEPRAKQQGLPPLQLYNLDTDPAETTNLVDQHPDVVARLLRRLNQEVRQGRCTPGEPVSNDRNVRFLPEGVELPAEETSTPRALLETESLVYKVVDDRELQLHIEKPGDWQPNDRRPAIVFFFGGGWVGGTPNQFKPQSEFLAGHGMVGIRVEYRTIDRAGADPPVICCQDAKSAMRYVRSHAAELGIDPDRIVASGGSAGGHLAAFTSMVDGIDDPNDDTDVSPRANALVLFNPVFDNGPDQGWGHARVGERYREFSPAHNISADDPPALVFLGDSDNLIPVVVLERFQERMRQAGVTCEARVYENAGHGFFNREPHLSQTLEATVEFLRAQRILD
ncbi:MAG: sulfatase-like hydrolase/transferase [Pirellulaceae bacterium]